MQTKRVTLTANEPTTVDGVLLPAGRYNGKEKRLSTHFRGTEVFLDPEYELELGTADVKVIPGWENTLGATLNATANVLDGTLVVS
ncbi:hypothetical protein FKO01_25390 [Mesorhizobium sp. B2-3-3]|nr:hypothetical protein FKO01_25390 [Mesorhizobium sp. B2-3-3]